MLHVEQPAVLQVAVNFFMDANLPLEVEGSDELVRVRMLHVVAVHACPVCLLQAFCTACVLVWAHSSNLVIPSHALVHPKCMDMTCSSE